MPKHQKTTLNSANPLSSARKGIGMHNPDSTGIVVLRKNRANLNAQRKSEDLWHRKSGAGYHLFIKYYGSQPCGVVTDASDFKIGFNTNSTYQIQGSNQSESIFNLLRPGMSRAAKKRQKKKRKTLDNDTSPISSCGSVQLPSQVDAYKILPSSNTREVEQLNTLNPLSHAFISHSQSYPHLCRFINVQATPLPVTFRLRIHDLSIFTKLKSLLSDDYSDEVLPVFYDASRTIYQSTLLSSLSKSNLGILSPKLKSFLVDGSMNGTLARQELGSMLPVLSLQALGAIKKGSKVLDLCASPGSKTLQALEVIASQDSSRRGRIVANDVHTGRLDSLREAVARSGLPEVITSRIIYTNYNASVFPFPKSGNLFDAILCDVPCSGDGTIRKDKQILPLWSPHTGNELHVIQLKILSRALQLVKLGGTICYSTCSLNPVENEAVVVAALNTMHDDNVNSTLKFKLIQWPKDLLHGFVQRPGVSDWKVAFYDLEVVQAENGDFGGLIFCANEEDAIKLGMKNTVKTLWPDEAVCKKVNSSRCIRLFPQDQNTGGFFIALIKRIQ